MYTYHHEYVENAHDSVRCAQVDLVMPVVHQRTRPLLLTRLLHAVTDHLIVHLHSENTQEVRYTGSEKRQEVNAHKK